MRKNILALVIVAVLLSSCFGTAGLYHHDEWEGYYFLRVHDNCCDEAKGVQLRLSKQSPEEYKWMMFFTQPGNVDTIYGNAFYEKKKMQFYVTSVVTATKYFKDPVNPSRPVFRIEYDDYYRDKEYTYVNHFTRWENELKEYTQLNKLFAGRSYHFKKNNSNESLHIPRKEKK